MIVSDVLVFVWVWFTMFFFHEICHGLMAWFINGYPFRIVCDISGFSLYMFSEGDIPESYRTLSFMSGGVLCSITCFLLVFLSTGWWQWCFLTVGWVQLIYGIMEGWFKNINRWYRYILYVVTVLVNLLIWWVF